MAPSFSILYFVVSSLFMVHGTDDVSPAIKDPSTDKPNIIFILADDLGWGNVGYHNTEVETPNIDYLVTHGLQLNRHYVDPECSPSRSSFQSGRLPVHVNTNNNEGILDPTMGIPPDMTPLAVKLQTAGYTTHMIGKWDVGFASFNQLPLNRGYDSFYGYLGHSVNYYSKNGNDICTEWYTDLWEDDAPALDSVEDVDNNKYVEFSLVDRMLSKLDEADESQPFFIVYASHLPHYPSQLPINCLTSELYSELEIDETMCLDNAGADFVVYPGWDETSSTWACRSILQAQVTVLDEVVGQITGSLNENDLWDNTLIIFATDNGGSLEMRTTAGNNYPLRGGKASSLEGGIRGTTFVSGGYLPESRRGELTNGMMHIADWYATFSEMLGVESSDTAAVAKGLPDIDGFNMWPLIAGETEVSPRSELVINSNVLFKDEWKLILGHSTGYAIWQSAVFPNDTTANETTLQSINLVCDTEKNFGCLFDVVDDPSEYNNVADANPDKVAEMVARMTELKETFWSYADQTVEGVSSCPSDIDLDDCGCWMSQHNWNAFAGPYMDLEDDQINFSNEGNVLETDHVKDASMNHVWTTDHLKDFKANLVIYVVLIGCMVLVYVFCGRRTHENKIMGDQQKPSTYGTVSV